eukprot:gene4396-8751_t
MPPKLNGFISLLIICVLTSEIVGLQQNNINSALCDIVSSTNIGQKYSSWSCAEDSTPIDDVCLWTGILCRSNEIIYLDMHSFSLSGTIPSSIGQLSTLEGFDFSNNQLNGPIPSSIGDLSALNRLAIHRNKLTGPIPSQLSQLQNIVSVSLYENSLSGTIPPSIGQLSNLQSLCINATGLAGSLPTEIGLLTGLLELVANSNYLTGTIPPSIGQLVLLQRFEIYQNSLIGSIPSEIGFISGLQTLRAYQNALTSTIPSTIGNMYRLFSLKLFSNRLQGNIPSEIGLCTTLQYLFLDHNALTNTVPSSIGLLSDLLFLRLSANNLIGTIPESIGTLSKLETFHFFQNRISGQLLSFYSKMSSLSDFEIFSNSLSGSLPAYLCDSSVHSLFTYDNPGLTCYAACLTSITFKNYGGLYPCMPTPHPTVAPTLRPKHAQQVISCLEFSLGDRFGDSWDATTRLFVMDSHHYAMYYPTCDNNPLDAPVVCFDSLVNKNGDYVKAHLHSESNFAWEIFWQVNNSGIVYTGSVNTTMTFKYHFQPPRNAHIYLESSEQLVYNDYTCSSCAWGSPLTTTASTGKAYKYQSDVFNPNYGNNDNEVFASHVDMFSQNDYETEEDYMAKDDDAVYDEEEEYTQTEEEYSGDMGNTYSDTNNGMDEYDESSGDGMGGGGSGSGNNWRRNLLQASVVNIQEEQSQISNTSTQKRTLINTSISKTTTSRGLKYSRYQANNAQGGCPCLPMWLGQSATSTSSTNMWYSGNDLNTEYFISDLEGSRVAASGTLCADGTSSSSSSSSSQCEVCLGQGNYLWRVTGALDRARSVDIAWEFCDVRGGSETEMSFLVDSSCSCVPISTATSSDYCDSSSATTASTSSSSDSTATETLSFSLEGIFRLHGMTSPELSEEEKTVLRGAIAQEMNEAVSSRTTAIDTNDIHFLDSKWTQNTGNFNSKSAQLAMGAAARGLLRHVVEVVVSVQIPMSILEEKKIKSDEMSVFVSSVESHFHRNMRESSLFLGKLRIRSQNKGTHRLMDISTVELVSLDVSFIGATIMDMTFVAMASLTVLPIVLLVVIFLAFKRRRAYLNQVLLQGHNLGTPLDYSIHYKNAQFPTTLRSSSSTSSNIHGSLDHDRDRRTRIEVLMT